MDPARKRRLSDLLFRSGTLAAARGVRVRALRRPVLTILGYHRVTADPPPFAPLAVDPVAFEAQIAWFRRRFDLWPLGRVGDWLEGRERLRRDTLVITFDDGYLDNHRHAAPILEQHGAPATFFVSTGPVCRSGPFWWDALRQVLDDPRRREAAGGAVATAAPAELRAALHRYLGAQGPEGRRAEARALLGAARRTAPDRRAAWLATLLGTPAAAPGGRREPDLLGPDELRDLARRGFAIGAHTVSHASLPELDAPALAAEVRGSIEDLRRLGIEPAAFAYPYGDAGESGGAVERAVRDAGVRLAVTTEERPVRRDDGRLRLPRKVVPEQPLALLATRLERLAWRG